jgi:TetR/AcrR family transcriptional regulator, repressor of fatR-cypB operon
VTDRRAAVLAAALELFERDGYGNVAMSRIATSAGVAAGTIYTYFRSKEELANALYRQAKTALAGELLGEPTDGDARGDFGRFWRSLVEFATMQPLALSFLENHRHDVYLDDESRALGARVDAGAAEFVRRGQRSGEIRPGPPEALAALVFGAFVGLLRAGHEGRLPLDRALFVDMEDAVWGLLAPPERRDGDIQ